MRSFQYSCVFLVSLMNWAFSVETGEVSDQLKCLDHFLDKFIRLEAPMKIEALLGEYSGKAANFGPELRKFFMEAHTAVEHSFEHIKDRIDDGMSRVRLLASDESFRYLLSNKFVAEVMMVI